jgi:hypothetical protein
MAVDLASVATPETGELCPTFVDTGSCPCSRGNEFKCVLPAKRLRHRKKFVKATTQGWIRDAMLKAGRIKDWTDEQQCQVARTSLPRRGEQGALF